MYTMLRYRQVLVVLFALTAGFALHGLSAEVYVVPKENNTVLLNPGKGWIIYSSFANASSSAWAKASVGYTRYMWKDIHTNDNQFNWALIDNDLAECVKRGKQFAFGVMTVNSSGSGLGLPQWVADAGAKFTESAPVGKVPVWDDPVFISKIGQFVAALTKRYNGNPDIAFIDCRTFGNWGEWHLGGCGGKDPGEAVKRQYLDQWAGFDQTHIIVPISGGTGMEPGGYGFYARDTHQFGAREDSADAWWRWKTCLPFLNYAPSVAEWNTSWGSIRGGGGWSGGWDDSVLSGQIEGSKYSYVNLGQWNGTDADTFLKDCPAQVDVWQNKMGYWFKMTSATYPGDLGNGTPGRLAFTMRNDGVAPLYVKKNAGLVKLALLDSGKNVLEACVLQGVNPFDWKPGQTSTNASFAFAKHADAAHLAFGVFTKSALAHPDVRLGIDGGTSNNWYVLTGMPKKDILTRVGALRVLEGSNAAFQVKLAVPPAGDAAVTVARTAGDSDIAVSAGARLVFTPANWDVWQNVTLVAAEDADAINGSATITCAGKNLISVDVTATEIDNDATRYQMRIDLSGYTRPAPLTNFPLLVILGTNRAGFAYSQLASPDGSDLRFTAADGVTELPYEIDAWNTNGNSYVWVQVPKLTAKIWITASWGDVSQATSPGYTTNGAVWDGNYKGVWHLSETGPRSDRYDSTQYRLQATPRVKVSKKEGAVFLADHVSGGEHLEAPNVPTLENLQEGDYTIEAWFRPNTKPPGASDQPASGAYGIVNKQGFNMGLIYGRTCEFRFVHYTADGRPNCVVSPVAAPPGVMYHVAGTVARSTGKMRICVNGQSSEVAIGTNAVAYEYKAMPWRFGAASPSGDWSYPADGAIDEVRLSSTARTVDWLWAEYMNVASNSTLTAYGAVKEGKQ